MANEVSKTLESNTLATRRPTAAEIEAYIFAAFPQGSEPTVRVDEVSDERCRVRIPRHRQTLRPGATVAGPTLMMLADTVAWVVLLHRLGIAAASSATSSLNIHFLARPRPADLVAEGRVLRLGRRLAVIDVVLTSEGTEEPVASATVTYAVSGT